MKKLLRKLWIYIRPFLNWRFLVSFAIPWIIVNGIWYVGLFVGTKYKINWLATVCGSYVAFLYTPFAMEKLITVPMAIAIHTKIFGKKDTKTQQQLQIMYDEARKDWDKLKSKFKRKKKDKS